MTIVALKEDLGHEYFINVVLKEDLGLEKY